MRLRQQPSSSTAFATLRDKRAHPAPHPLVIGERIGEVPDNASPITLRLSVTQHPIGPGYVRRESSVAEMAENGRTGAWRTRLFGQRCGLSGTCSRTVTLRTSPGGVCVEHLLRLSDTGCLDPAVRRTVGTGGLAMFGDTSRDALLANRRFSGMRCPARARRVRWRG